MNTSRRSFFPALASIFAGLPALLGMKRAEGSVSPTKWLTFRRHGLLIDNGIQDVKPIGGPSEMEWEGGGAIAESNTLPPGWHLTMIGRRGNIVCSEKLSENGLEAIRWRPISELPVMHLGCSKTYPEFRSSRKLLGLREKGSIITVMCIRLSDSEEPRFQECVTGIAMTDVRITHWSYMPNNPNSADENIA
jgi:hypothetical protein